MSSLELIHHSVEYSHLKLFNIWIRPVASRSHVWNFPKMYVMPISSRYFRIDFLECSSCSNPWIYTMNVKIARIILRERIFDTMGIDPHHDVSSMSWLLTIGQWGTNPCDHVYAVGNVHQHTIKMPERFVDCFSTTESANKYLSSFGLE